ncbi:patatin-like protein 2 [Pyrus ussuriensis x Pyrus communis]|uniref:Patatin-like protein 2 n=1 Tax=Pyrus ussuriensis x Pyrus communis TaxID=2448454 RepID=A0A5N5GUS8_9ROSA|nr:patatin-like protein 2 [Pyrus ussuriensis x Pyrus communis]
MTNEIKKENPDIFPVKPVDYGRFLVISLGIGSSKAELKYHARSAAKWSLLIWLTSATKKNLANLVKVGERLLKQQVSRVNLDSGKIEASNHETNAEALIRFAKLLSKEKRSRQAGSTNGHAENTY